MIDHTMEALRKNRYDVSFFSKKEEALAYLLDQIKNKTVGFGDSQTLETMNLNKELSRENHVIDPAIAKTTDEFLRVAKNALTTEVYVTSVSALTSDGIMVNMDGTGNRVAGSLFGHEKVYFILGTNKIVKNLEEAVWRVRNIAAPKNAKRLGKKTPCAIKGDRCYDCSSPERICNGMIIHHKAMSNIKMEVILVDDEMGL